MDPEPARYFSSLLPAALLLAASPLDFVLGFLAILLLLISSALFSGSEIAFFSLTHNDFDILEQENTPSSKRILKLKDKPRQLLATILISNNFVNIAIVILSDFVLLKTIPEEVFTNWGNTIVRWFAAQQWLDGKSIGLAISFLIFTVGITFLLVLFGEVAPKVYAKINNVQLARLMSNPLNILMSLLAPLNYLLVNMTNVIETRLVDPGQLTSREDIDEAIELAVRTGQETDQEIDILKSIVKFGDVSVKQIMCSRVDVVAVDFRLSYDELLTVVRESGYSRIPVYDNDFDNVTGILYVKDLLGHLSEGPNYEWQSLIRTNVLYVPEAKKIDDLLKEFQRERLHMAIVVDEYGGSSGIVTLEDIMEEIIGEIKDEFDDESELDYQDLGNGAFLFDGKTLINDACRIIGADTSIFDPFRGESDSLAGLILEYFAGIPKKDTELVIGHYKFKIVSVNKRRIEKILLSKLPDSEPPAPIAKI